MPFLFCCRFINTFVDYNDDMYKITDNSFVSSGGNPSKYIITDLIENTIQQEKQNNSILEYEERHEKEEHPAKIINLMDEFQQFIALHVLLNNHEGAVLDVGCGISTKHPLYFKALKNSNLTYIGLDPFEKNQTNREYLFINGKFEGLHKHIDSKVDYLIFSTSLDHFENLEEVKNEIVKILKPNGLAFFWVGVHDANVISRWRLSYGLFENFNVLSIPDLLSTLIKAPLRILYTFLSILIRTIKLKKKIPLDNLHFHYFTEESLEFYLSSVGEIAGVKKAPLSNSFFYAIKPH